MSALGLWQDKFFIGGGGLRQEPTTRAPSLIETTVAPTYF